VAGRRRSPHRIHFCTRPGAKPLIDIIAGIRDLQESRAAYTPLGEIGYVYTPHRPHESHHFAKRSANWWERTHNLHLTEVGSALWCERLAFGDALRADPALTAEYSALKQRLAAQCEDGRTTRPANVASLSASWSRRESPQRRGSRTRDDRRPAP
jgi:GrpB-like predicted nucleotidyltransferase (UPF0157 family)